MCSIGWWMRTGPMRGCAGCRPETSSSPFCTGNWRARRACARSKPASPAMRTGSTTSELGRYRARPSPTPMPSARARHSARCSLIWSRRPVAACDARSARRYISSIRRDCVCGAKLHIVYDCDAERPIDAAITPARLNDITAAQALPIAAGATYVFDLGYYDFVWWARLDDAGCRIVTRFKSNTRLIVVAENRVSKDGPILSDRIGYLAASRTNPFQAPVR